MRRQGYDAVSFGTLAQEIGIKTASIHYHFPKKADLAEALLETYAAKLARQRRNIAANAATGGAALASLIALYRVALNEGRQLCLCVAFTAGRDSLAPPVLAVLNRFQSDTLSWLKEIFAWAQADGSIAGLASPEDEAAACLALLEGAQLMARAAESLVPYDAATAALKQRIGGL